MECSVEPNTQALCQAIRAAARGPSAKAYTIAPILALYGVNTRYATVARLPHCIVQVHSGPKLIHAFDV